MSKSPPIQAQSAGDHRRSPALAEVVVREIHSRDVAEEDPLRVEDPLRRTGGAGRVEEDGRVFGPGGPGLVAARAALELAPEVARAVRLPVHREHGLEVGEAVEGRSDAGEAPGVGDEHPRRAVGEPELEVIEPELREERHRHRAALEAREVHDRGLQRLAEQDRHPVSGLDAAGLEEVRATVGELPDPVEGPLPRAARLALHHEGDPPGVGGVAVAGVVRHVVALGDVPAKPLVDRRVVVGPGNHLRAPRPSRLPPPALPCLRREVSGSRTPTPRRRGPPAPSPPARSAC